MRILIILGILVVLILSGCVEGEVGELVETDTDLIVAELGDKIDKLELDLSRTEKILSTCENENVQNLEYFKDYEKADFVFLAASDAFDEGGIYYTQASISYDIDDLDSVISNCETAREYYGNSMNESIRAKLKYEKLNPPTDFFKKEVEYSIKLSELSYDISFAMYEACEYFESAARAYDADNYDMGDSNIEGMNERITLYDEKVEEYNTYLIMLEELYDE